MVEIRICAVCNKPFEARRENEVCCSAECKQARRRQQCRQYDKEDAQKRKLEAEKRKKLSSGENSLTEIAIEARKAGMTYGQYVAKMGL